MAMEANGSGCGCGLELMFPRLLSSGSLTWDSSGCFGWIVMALIELWMTVVEGTVQDRTVGLEPVRLFFSGLKVYHLPPASSVREDAYSTKACSGIGFAEVYAMLRDFWEVSPFIKLVLALQIKISPMMLLEHQDIVSEFCGPSRWKELSKESGSKILQQCGDGILLEEDVQSHLLA
ncbi:hypothetical protein Tco_0998398 [Tanacetum coccineum]